MFEFLSAYADGECTPKERRLVEAYLSENADGRAFLAELRSQSAFVAGDAVEPPDWLGEAILAKTSRKNRRFGWPVAAGFAASAAAAAFAIALFWPVKPVLHPPLLAANEVSVRPPANKTIAWPKVASAPSVKKSVPVRQRVKKEQPEIIQVINMAEGVDEAPLPVKLSQMRSTPKPSNPAVTVSYTGADYSQGQKAEPTAPDVVAMAAQTSDDHKEPTATAPIEKRAEGAVLPDARERLRERLKKLNQERKDIKDAVGTK